MNSSTQKEFMYLFERIGEPLYFGPKGEGENLTFYNVPMTMCESLRHASTQIKKNFSARNNIRVDAPAIPPDLTNISRCCPKNTIFSYFNPIHKVAAQELKSIFMAQSNQKAFMSMACVCRDSELVNPKLWLNAFASAILTRADTRGFRIPAFWEIMPDEFVNGSTIKQAQKMSVMPPEDRPLIVLDQFLTARNTDLENKLAYFREDMGINSHHWHWHIIYGLEEAKGVRDRKGELFYYMHHAMLARYEAERLSNGLPRTKVLNMDDPVKEAYFSKLTDSNSGLTWGGRQANTKLSDVDRSEDPGSLPLVKISLEDCRKYKDRILEAIDSGNVLLPDGKTTRLTMDMLGDMVESSSLTPNPQFYSGFGLHNMGHVVISFAHDPKAKYREQNGPMADTTTAMRDPVFYRWHKFIDELFDSYKQILQPYQDTHSDKSNFPLKWNGIETKNVGVVTDGRDKRPNVLTTFWMQSDIDLSRGLDFGRNNSNNLGPIWARKTHLNHDAFTYNIMVKNNSGSNQKATVRIFMAPRLNENGVQFEMVQQRKLFFEMDKFTADLKPGDNNISRKSSDSTVTIPWEQTFRELEREENLTPQQAVCGCGWPQHMLVPKGNPNGMIFDLVVFLTNARDDEVKLKNASRTKCRESMSFCGILDDLYPDAKPMGYPFDRNPYLVPGTLPAMQTFVSNLEQYIARIPNMGTAQIRVVHMPSRLEVRPGGAPQGISTVNAEPSTRNQRRNCPETNPGNNNAQTRPPNNGNGPVVFQPTSNSSSGNRYGRSSSPDSSGSWSHLDHSRSPSPTHHYDYVY